MHFNGIFPCRWAGGRTKRQRRGQPIEKGHFKLGADEQYTLPINVTRHRLQEAVKERRFFEYMVHLCFGVQEYTLMRKSSCVTMTMGWFC